MRPNLHLSAGYHWIIAAIVVGLIGVIMGSGCANDKHSLVQPGQTTAAGLKQLLGEPNKTDTSKLRPQAQLLEYSGKQIYQVEQGVVVAHNRPPQAAEITLQYWRHLWQSKGIETKYEEVKGTRNPHGQAQFQLTAPRAKMSVIYDPVQDQVVRVVEYGTGK